MKFSILICFLFFSIANAWTFIYSSHEQCRNRNVFFYWEAIEGQTNECRAHIQSWFFCALLIIITVLANILIQALTNCIEGIDRRKSSE
ncbi:unnamed protein product [Caenorhabditis angaria]|uniref:Uncharacterized protein n=1 Tax=Caenorhabditis angaria TaxID=860376 RepID=A0A9P1IJC4_9PELO|nr:unnamed protein product [Caenorhabditis angaria]